MKKITHPIRLLSLMTLLVVGSASAEPRVVVSIEPIHSLVSALMEGIAEPVLLVEEEKAAAVNLDAFQQSRMITADLIIRVGAGLETSMASTLQQMPAMHNKVITLSNHLPLLVKDDFHGDVSVRQQSRNLAFWYDPKLSVMAVRHITPTLVRLDPDHQEQYLDNEIALIKKLKKLHHDISSLFENNSTLTYTNLQQLNRYFSHRFIESQQPAETDHWQYRTVSTKPATHCPGIQPVQNSETASDLYFHLMRNTARAAIACMSNQQQHPVIAKL